MEFRLPEVSDKELLVQYVLEHFMNNEERISASLGLSKMRCEAWVEMVHKNASVGDNKFEKSLEYLCFDEDNLIGLLNVRYELAQQQREIFGDIGYGVRPSQRNKGYGTKILEFGLKIAKEKGMRQVIIGCLKTNVASANVIKKNGGILVDENEKYKPGEISQYYEIKL